MVTIRSIAFPNMDILAPGDPGANAPPPRYHLIEDVIEEMRRQAAEGGLSLNDMAEVAHLSRYHFSRTFRRVTGIPPGEFMNALRLERAKELLMTTDLSVGEVCHEVGYSSQGTFTSRFKQLVGLPPGQMHRLPEDLELAFETLGNDGLSAAIAHRDAHGVSGRVAAPGLEQALIFVGLFDGALPRGYPIAGTVLMSPAEFRISDVPDGSYHLMAAAVPIFHGPASLLLPGSNLHVGRAENLITVRHEAAEGYTDITLRSPQNTDPPVLISLPMLLIKLMNSDMSPAD